MEWNDAQSLAIIDQEIGDRSFSPAEYEILRRAIWQTADFEYQSLIHFSERSLQLGAEALTAGVPIVVDVPMVQVGILPYLQKTFASPVYCALDQVSLPKAETIKKGIKTLAKLYSEAIFIIGQEPVALTALVELIEVEEIQPALVIGTPSGFVEADVAKYRLEDSMVPHIRVDGRKGSAVVAAATFNGLVDLAWEAYQQDRDEVGY